MRMVGAWSAHGRSLLASSHVQELLKKLVVRCVQHFRDDGKARRNCFELVLQGNDELILQAATANERAAWLDALGGIGPMKTVRLSKTRSAYVGLVWRPPAHTTRSPLALTCFLLSCAEQS